MSRSSVSPVRQTGHGAYTCLSGYPFFYEGVLLFRHARAARKAWITETPAKAVMPEASLSGRTSTRSMAATSIFLQIFGPCRGLAVLKSLPLPGCLFPGRMKRQENQCQRLKNRASLQPRNGFGDNCITAPVVEFVAQDDPQAFVFGIIQDMLVVKRSAYADLYGFFRNDQSFVEGMVERRAVVIGFPKYSGTVSLWASKWSSAAGPFAS